MATSEFIEKKSIQRSVSWERQYARILAVSDTLVVFIAVVAAQVVWSRLDIERDLAETSKDRTDTMVLAAIVGVAWLLALKLYGSRDSRVVGVGVAEYRRVLQASFAVFGLLAIGAYVAESRIAVKLVVLAFPVGFLGMAIVRWLWRQWLRERRRRGSFVSRVLLVGSEGSVAELAIKLKNQPEVGYRVVGACVPHASFDDVVPGTDVPVFGDFDEVIRAMERSGADTLAITNSDELSAAKTRELSWELEPGKYHLVVAPSLTDIGGPRIHTRPVAGLPLIHVETPRYEGSKQFTKRAFDIAASGVLILLLSPIMAAIAVCVRLSTPGPIFFQQERVGRNGDRFGMMKFRTMVPDAELLLGSLSAAHRGEGNSVLFKMKDDPRVTPIGRILRRYSLDELPQLFNVFDGTMSLVGPRPSLQREVDLYENHVRRRFLVKPGITGLWQVSGRSNLTWEESVRLDLYYVENWTLLGDILILWQTAKAVVGKDGAY